MPETGPCCRVVSYLLLLGACGLAGCGDGGGSSPHTDGSGGGPGGTGGTGPSLGGGTATGGTSGTGSASSTGGVPNGDPCPPLAPSNPEGATRVTPAQARELASMLASAQPDQVFLLEDGTYDLGGDCLYLNVDGVTLRSASGDREAVILDNAYQGGSILQIGASRVTIADLTVTRAVHHPIHVSPVGQSSTGVLLYNLRIIDPGQQAVKVNQDASETLFTDDGVLACSHLELTDAGREHVSDCYTGGLDAHRVRNWTVRDNTIVGFYCAQGLSEHGIHFWRGGRDNTIVRNTIIDSVRGIGLGMGSDEIGRRYDDSPCGGTIAQAYSDLVANNVVFASSAALFASESGFDTGIGLESACDATVVHNTVYSTQAPFASLDVRFQPTSGLVANNLFSHSTRQRDDGAVTLSSNIEDAPASTFVDAAGGDLHLSASATAAIGQADASAAATVADDMDALPRTDGAPDIGADERD